MIQVTDWFCTLLAQVCGSVRALLRYLSMLLQYSYFLHATSYHDYAIYYPPYTNIQGRLRLIGK